MAVPVGVSRRVRRYGRATVFIRSHSLGLYAGHCAYLPSIFAVVNHHACQNHS
jgi:hypothetical protein